MRVSLKKPKTKTTTVLQEESTKLKQKLQLLRQQVTLKKQNKEMNKTATSLTSKPLAANIYPNATDNNKTLSRTTKSTLTKFPDSRLRNFLIQSKLDALQQKLKDKGVTSYERFVELDDQQIDGWKDVAVGYRIKLKKQVRLYKELKQSSAVQNFPSQHQKISADQFFQKKILQEEVKQNLPQPREKNIEDIIKQRKEVQVFVPICRQNEEFEEEQQQQPEMTEEDQDVIIRSFMKVFQPRKGIISKSPKIQLGKDKSKVQDEKDKKFKKVSWSRAVQKLEEEFMLKNHKTYPKQAIVKQALLKMHDSQIQSSQSLPEGKQQPAVKYCWKCFSKVNIRQKIGFGLVGGEQGDGAKYFCSQKCQNQYQGEVQELKYQFATCIFAESNSGCLQMSKQAQQSGDDGDGIQIIDLSIL